jgi:hypothetical protein
MRTDVENLKRLEELRPAFERLTAERIRAESEIERLTRELDAARRLAREQLGTDDEDEIRRLIEDQRAENTRRVDAFASALKAIDQRLAKLGGEA